MRKRQAPRIAGSALTCIFAAVLFLVPPPESFAARGGKGGRDRTPPTLTVSSPADGLETTQPTVSVSGAAVDDNAMGTVEAAVNGGPPSALPLEADGAFAGEVTLAEGSNAIVVTASDAAGNTTSATRNVTLAAGPSPVTIISPRDGDLIHGAFIDLYGTYEAPVEDLGLLTYYGLAENGVINYPAYQLEEGENRIVLGGYDAERNEYRHEITVTRVDGRLPVSLIADRTSGEAPITVNFSIVTDTPETPALCEADFEGDGTFAPLDDCSGWSHTFTTSRLYRPALRMHTSEGHRYSAWTDVSVHGPATYLAEFPVDNPVDMAMDNDGNIYVLEGTAGRVVVMSEDGDVARTFGSSGAGDGQFSNPSSIAVDPDGRIYVSDTGNSRVQFFSPAGVFLGKWGRYGSKYGQISFPRGIAIDNGGDLILADTGNGRVEVMRREDGHWERSVGEAELAVPADVLWLPGVDFAVSDEATNKVLVFSPRGGSARELKKEVSPLVSPAGLSYDRHNNCVVIADRGANSIVLADYEDEAFNTLRVVSSAVGDPKSFSSPTAALRGAAAHEDIYFIADSGNDRIVKIRLETGPVEDPRAAWNAVRQALQNNDVDGALEHFAPQTQEAYRQIFTGIAAELPQVTADMGEIHPLSVSSERASYGVVRYDNDKPYLFEVHFVRDRLGGWKILHW